MPRRKPGGTTLTMPLFQRVRNPGLAVDFVDELHRGNNRARCDFVDDFLIGGLTAPTAVVPSSQSPIFTGLPGGVWTFPLSAGGVNEWAGFSWGDALLIDSRKAFFFQARVTVGAVAANSRYAFGLGSAFVGGALDFVTKNVWFRIEGADRSLYCEVDDALAVDLDDQDTGFDTVEGAWNLFTIDGRDLGTIRFYVGENLVKTLPAPLLSGNLQPMLMVAKDGASPVMGFNVDYYRVSWDRE